MQVIHGIPATEDTITAAVEFGPKRDGENCIMRSCMVGTLRPVLLG
jgi:hypothetical protein